jgi:hypothetical protein
LRIRNKKDVTPLLIMEVGKGKIKRKTIKRMNNLYKDKRERRRNRYMVNTRGVTR